MIAVQTALVIAGIVVFAVVAVISYHRYKSAAQVNRTEEIDVEESSSILHTRLDPRPSIFDAQAGFQSITGPRREPKLKTESAELQAEPIAELQAESITELQAESITELQAESITEQQRLPPLPERGEPESSEPVEDLSDAPQAAAEMDPFDGDGDFGREEYDPEDPLPIELVARIPGDNAINRDTVLGLYRQFEFDLKKQHRIFGLLYPEKTWRDLEKQPESAQFTHFGISVQLADRSGPITESELNRFSQMVLRFAEVFGRRFKFSVSLNDALECAQKLDVFCKKYDAVAILNVVSRDQDFRGSHIHQCAREMGLQLNERSIYEKRQPKAQGGELLYTLASLQHNGELPESTGSEVFTTSGIALFMNIPCSTNPAQVFNNMIADAKDLCKRLDGKLVDHNLRGMTQKGLKRISQQIRQIVQDMESEGVRPGSEKTHRLF